MVADRQELKALKELLIFGGQWDNFHGEPRSKLKSGLQWLRTIYLITSCISNGIIIYNNGFKSSLNGTIVFFPVTILGTMQALSMLFNHKHIVQVLTSLDICLSLHDEKWKENILSSNYKTVTKTVKQFKICILVCVLIYFTIPFILDLCFSLIIYYEKPYIPPMPLTLTTVNSRNFKYITYTIFNLGWGVVIGTNNIGFVGSYLMVLTYSNTLLKILKQQILINEKNDFVSIIEYHNSVIRINESSKKLFGFPCIFHRTMMSSCICLCLFIATNTDDPMVFVAYSYGFIFYLSLGYLFCILGQLLENESTRIFETLYSIPWYTCSPKVRKDINMMIRQARKPMSIDYKGRSPMNLRTYMQVLHTSYSYFMLLQSVAK